MDLVAVGRSLLAFSAVLAVLGLLALGAGKGVLPRVPGDLSFQVGGVRVFAPLGTSILLSIVLTLLMRWLSRR